MNYLEELANRTWCIAWSIAPISGLVMCVARSIRCRPTVLHAAWVATSVALLLPFVIPARRHVFDLPGATVGPAGVRWLWEFPAPWWVAAIPASALLARLVYRSITFRKRLATCVPAPMSVHKQVVRLAKEIGLREAPSVRWAPGGQAPFVLWGPRRSRLFLPGSEWQGWSSEQRDAVVLHELAHLRRRDGLTGLASSIAVCVYWWNPLAWCLRNGAHDAAERCCDRWVTTLRHQAREAYARALLSVAARGKPQGALGINGICAEKRRIAGRIRAILIEQRPPQSRSRVLATIVAVLIIGIGLTWGQSGLLQTWHELPTPQHVELFLRTEARGHVRRVAVDAVGNLGPESATWASPVLAQRFPNEPSASVRYEILDALERLEARSTITGLSERAVRDTSARVRRRARELFARYR